MLINCGVPECLVLGLLLFVIFINDLHKAIQYFKVHLLTNELIKTNNF